MVFDDDDDDNNDDDDGFVFYVPFNIIEISRRWKGDDKKPYAMKRCTVIKFRLQRLARFEPRTL